MKRPFTKLNGLGNDFVFIDDPENTCELSVEQVKRLCDRHFGIGADGVIVVKPSARPECAAYMHYINSDGTLAQMCGNGVRCFAKYLVDHGQVSASEGCFVADTLAGPKPITFTVDDTGKLTHATVDMGVPMLEPARVPVNASANAKDEAGKPYVCELPVESPWGTFYFTCVSMGNPHAVCFIDDWSALTPEAFTDPTSRSLATFDVARVGAFFEAHELFPEKTNVEFACVDAGTDVISMRVFERGCGETLACGTGACATGIAAALTEWTGRETDVQLLGGTLHVLWDAADHVFMTGPAEESFSGTVEL